MKVGGRKVGERREERAKGESCGGAWESNWTLDNTFTESFTSSASPEGESLVCSPHQRTKAALTQT